MSKPTLRQLRGSIEDLESSLRELLDEDNVATSGTLANSIVQQIRSIKDMIDDDENPPVLKVGLLGFEGEVHWTRDIHLLEVVTGEGRFDLAMYISQQIHATLKDTNPKLRARLKRLEADMERDDRTWFDD